MKPVLVTEATFDALELDEIKARPELRLTTNDDDAFLSSALKSAVEAYQDFTDNILCSSTWDLYMDDFPLASDEIETPGPLSSVTSITYMDDASPSTWDTFSSDDYEVDTTNPIQGRIKLAWGECWETPYTAVNAVKVRFVAGYANAAAIPQRIKDGLIAYIQEQYDGQDRSTIYYRHWANYRRFHGI